MDYETTIFLGAAIILSRSPGSVSNIPPAEMKEAIVQAKRLWSDVLKLGKQV